MVPHGSIDTETHDNFRSVIGPLLNNTTKAITIDLNDVDYISSAGLGVFFSMQEKMKKMKAQLLFCHLKPPIKKLFDIVRTLPKEHQFQSLEEADKFLHSVVDAEEKKTSH